jgi:hypothetical protein
VVTNWQQVHDFFGGAACPPKASTAYTTLREKLDKNADAAIKAEDRFIDLVSQSYENLARVVDRFPFEKMMMRRLMLDQLPQSLVQRLLEQRGVPPTQWVFYSLCPIFPDDDHRGVEDDIVGDIRAAQLQKVQLMTGESAHGTSDAAVAIFVAKNLFSSRVKLVIADDPTDPRGVGGAREDLGADTDEKPELTTAAARKAARAAAVAARRQGASVRQQGMGAAHSRAAAAERDELGVGAAEFKEYDEPEEGETVDSEPITFEEIGEETEDEDEAEVTDDDASIASESEKSL